MNSFLSEVFYNYEEGFRKKIGSILLQNRKMKGLSIVQAALKLGINAFILRQIEQGTFEGLTKNQIFSIALFYRINLCLVEDVVNQEIYSTNKNSKTSSTPQLILIPTNKSMNDRGTL